ncbi:Cas1p-domain-containing protein [Rhizodiscina lignyota]|uniref:Cas1p-domain-containing protein n=1 Tax=Rhizodiscina lignyota TaxID=1504668 RepID=A0A9P4IBL7_9PEZI|nr:Cas1p-domain-containing protein [Rhizodiscina lignyota]
MIKAKPLHAASFAEIFNYVAYFLIAAILLSATYRRYDLDSQDPYKCEALLNDGQWLDSLQSNGSRSPYKGWQAPGCLIHQYKPAEIARCVDDRKIVFAGDSTVRQVFWALARKLNKTEAEDLEHSAYKHEDQKSTINGVTLEFLWDPFLNGSSLYDGLRAYNHKKTGKVWSNNTGDSAALMVVGGGAWFSRWFDLAHSLREYQETLDNITEFTRSEMSLADTISTSKANDVGDQVFLTPIQIPIYDKLEGIRRETIIQGEVETMNVYLEDLSNRNNVLWSYLAMTEEEEDSLDPTGFHVVQNIADAKADVLLNLRCNAKLDQTGGYPYDRTCCSAYKPAVFVQWGVLLAGLAIAGFALYNAFRAEQQDATKQALFFAVATLAYCYLADRTQLFDKDKKHFENSEFFLLSGLTLLAGVLSIRRSGRPSNGGPPKDQPFLSRDQTEEWKGWMQFAILIYHWTGASSVLWIYEIIRLMVASYLFLTGFGHTCYFLKKGDFSFKRVAGVLVRLNLLSCALPYVMGTDYLFYYFAPLVTFWFGVVYLTMRVYSSRNDNTGFVIAKIAISAILVTILLETPIFDAIFAVLGFIARIHWDVHEWKFRLGLDRYIVFIGMLVALLFERYNTAVSSGSSLRSFNAIRISAIVASIIALPAVQLIYRTFPSKESSNAIQPFLAAVPILAFVVLRNASPTLRNFHSSVFAWLGKCSLETFTLQFHIWLAADTKGLLSIGIFHGDGSLMGDRWRDFIVLTPVFFWISWKLAAATGTITAWMLKEGDESDSGAMEMDTLEKGAWISVTQKQWRARVWPKDLRLRMGVLLAGMWVLNWIWW